jgi:hypothetical protein
MDWGWQLAAYRRVVLMRAWGAGAKPTRSAGKLRTRRVRWRKISCPPEDAGLPKNWADAKCHAI